MEFLRSLLRVFQGLKWRPRETSAVFSGYSSRCQSQRNAPVSFFGHTSGKWTCSTFDLKCFPFLLWKRYNKHLINLAFSVFTVSYVSFIRAWAINRAGKARSVTYSMDSNSANKWPIYRYIYYNITVRLHHITLRYVTLRYVREYFGSYFKNNIIRYILGSNYLKYFGSGKIWQKRYYWKNERPKL